MTEFWKSVLAEDTSVVGSRKQFDAELVEMMCVGHDLFSWAWEMWRMRAVAFGALDAKLQARLGVKTGKGRHLLPKAFKVSSIVAEIEEEEEEAGSLV